MDVEILKTIREKGLLLEKEVYNLLEVIKDKDKAIKFLEQLERISGKKLITKSTLNSNGEYVKTFIGNLGDNNKEYVEKVFINLGISLEIRREVKKTEKEVKKSSQNFKLNYFNTNTEKKLEVKDFVGHFRARYQQLQRILMQRAELQGNLVSINKISSDRTNLSIIGIVKDKHVTKNKNLIIKLEDLTGEISVLVKMDKKEVFEKADEILLDDVIGIKASGSREMLFVSDILYPESMIYEKMKFNEDKCIAFLSDMHCGSDRHLGEAFMNFLRWINSEDEMAKKIEYLFFVGDNVDGVGIFPNQEEVLKLKSMKGQYKLLAYYLRQIPKHITMFMCPGQHDAVRVAEPQPLISKRYAPELYEIENLILVTNPTLVKLLEGDKEFKVLMYHGASIHTFINEIKVLRLMKAHRTPAKAVEHMLKRRHLAPTHGDVVYIPSMDHDPLVITEVPDILCTGEVHRLDISNYNGILIITGSCWQSQTPFEEKVGNIPDPCKVPVMNLKTRELKIFDFSVKKDEVEKEAEEK